MIYWHNVTLKRARRTYRIAWLLVTLVYLVGFPRFVSAQPVVDSLFPPVVSLDDEIEIRFRGAKFSEQMEPVFYAPGFTLLETSQHSEYEWSARLRCDASVPLGPHPFRLWSDFGFSSLMTVQVTPFPVVTAESLRVDALDSELSAQMSQAVHAVFHRLPASLQVMTIAGKLADGSSHRFAVHLEQGEVISAEVVAVRLGFELLDTALTVLDPEGRPLLVVDDTPLFAQDPALQFVAASRGTHFIEINETNYRGGEEGIYLLHVGDFAPTAVPYPAGGQAGQATEITFVGQSATEVGAIGETTNVDIPVDAPKFQLRACSPGRAFCSPSPVPFRVSSFPNADEQDFQKLNEEVSIGSVAQNANALAADIAVPTSDAARREIVEIPISLNGRLEEPGDIDFFCLQGVAGEAWMIDVFAQRVGSPVDTFLSVYDADGGLIASNDDWESHDSRVEFRCPATGPIYVRINDKLGAGGPLAVYRMEVTRVEPVVTSFLPRPVRTSQEGQTISVPTGNRTLARLGVRRAFVEGDVELVIGDLPNGVYASPVVVNSSEYWVPVVLEASPELRPTGGLVSVRAMLPEDVRGGFTQVVDLIAQSADRLFNKIEVDRLAVAVTPPVPFRLELPSPETTLPVGGTITLTVDVVREPGFEEPLELRLPYLPPGIVCQDAVIVPAGGREATFWLEASEQVPTGSWQIAATARLHLSTASEAAQHLAGFEVASGLVALQIAEAPVVGEFASLATERGKAFVAICHLTHSGPLPDRLVATLEGLPNRVVAEPIEIDGSVSQVQFQVQMPEDSPVGEFKAIQCRLIGELAGHEVSYRVASNSTLIVAERGKLILDSQGQPKSPLEVLRSAQP